MCSNLSETGARMVTKLTAQRRYVAVSYLEWGIHNISEISNSALTSDKVQLMEFSEASWTVSIAEYSDDYGDSIRFIVYLCGIPEDLFGRSRAFMFVSCQGQSLCSFSSDYFDSFESQFTHNFCEKPLSDFFEVEPVLFSFRLAIGCDDELNTCCQFYDMKAYRKSLLNSVADMLGDPTFADFTFIVGGREFKVHMNILAAVSPVMSGLFTSDMEEARTKRCTVDDFTAVTFGQVLRFIYRGEVPKGFKRFPKPLYEAAHFYQIGKLKQICARKINKDLSLENALEVFEWVQIYDDFKQLKLDSWAIVKRDILKIVDDLKTEPLSVAQVRAVIKQREQEKMFWEKL